MIDTFFKYRIPIIATLSLHILALLVMNGIRVGNEHAVRETLVPISLNEILEEEMLLEKKASTVPLENVVANKDAKKSSGSRPSKQKMAESVMDELKYFEKSMFEQLQSSRKDTEQEAQDSDEDSELPKVKEEMKEIPIIASSMATVEHNLQPRYHVKLPVPSYMCKGYGKVNISIEINQEGKVVKAKLAQGLANSKDDCLIEKSIRYAKRAVFNLDRSAASIQKGIITFSFQAQ